MNFQSNLHETIFNWRHSGPFATDIDDDIIAALISYSGDEHDLTSRKQFPLHVTASAVVVDGDGSALMVRHTFLGKWLFPGGHLDPGEDMIGAAIRETMEETGLDVAAFQSEPLDVDMHTMPASAAKNEPAHWHCDFRYLFFGAVDRRQLRISPESTGMVWAKPDEIDQFWPGPRDVCERIRSAMRSASLYVTPEIIDLG